MSTPAPDDRGPEPAGLPTRTGDDGTLDLTPTPGQTVGPFFGYALPFEGGERLVDRGAPGAVRLWGVVRDGHGDPVPDALLELWQLDADGRTPAETGTLRRDPWVFTGFGRASVDREGRYAFTTVEPGPSRPGAARFYAVVVFARGLLDKLHTRVYLPEADQPAGALDADPLLAALPADERATLLAVRDNDGGLRFDVRLQGEGETVFLAFDEPAGRE